MFLATVRDKMIQIDTTLSFIFVTSLILLNQCCEAAKAISAVCSKAQENDFLAHKTKFNKNYKDLGEETERKAIWCGKDNYIKAHNEKNASHKLQHNWLSDKRPEELRGLSGHVPLQPIHLNSTERRKFCVTRRPPPVTWPVPEFVNWTADGVVVKPQNQGECGSCYAFASVAAVEAMIHIETGKPVDLSRENLIDCSVAIPNHYCKGGNAVPSFAYIANCGLYSTADYPYTSAGVPMHTLKRPDCKVLNVPLGLAPQTTANGFAHQYILNRFSETACLRWGDFGLDNAGDEELLKQFVAKQPVVVYVNAQDTDFHHYESGVLSIENCSLKTTHAVLIVGYGHDDNAGKDYWIIKNSWGGWQNCSVEDGFFYTCNHGWGQGGYALIERGKNMCGIAQEAVVPSF